MPAISQSVASRMPFTAYIEKVGSFLHVYNHRMSEVFAPTTSTKTAWDRAKSLLTGTEPFIEKITSFGNFSVDDQLSVPKNLIWEHWGSLTAVDSLNKIMIVNAGTKDYNVFLTGKCFVNGNRANQANTVCGVKFANSAELDYSYQVGQHYPAFKAENWSIGNCYDHGFEFDFTGSTGSTFELVNCNSYGHWNDAVKCTNCYDSNIIGGIMTGGNNLTFEMTGCANMMIHPSYVNGQSVFTNCVEFDFAGLSWELGVNADMISGVGLQYSKFHDMFFRVIGNGTANTYDGIKLSSNGGTHSIFNQFHNLHFTRRAGGGTRTFKYGIEETDANQDNNVYGIIEGGDCATGALRLLGAVSKTKYTASQVIGTVATA